MAQLNLTGSVKEFDLHVFSSKVWGYRPEAEDDDQNEELHRILEQTGRLVAILLASASTSDSSILTLDPPAAVRALARHWHDSKSLRVVASTRRSEDRWTVLQVTPSARAKNTLTPFYSTGASWSNESHLTRRRTYAVPSVIAEPL